MTWRNWVPSVKSSDVSASRYRPSQQYYFDMVDPADLADIIVHNDEPQQPAGKLGHADKSNTSPGNTPYAARPRHRIAP